MLKGKKVWVVGGGTGIGRAGALALAEGGAEIALSGRRTAELEETKTRIEKSGGTASIWPLDVTKASDVVEVADKIITASGRIDILINSAGSNVAERFWSNLTPQSFEKVIAANLQGTLNCIYAVLPQMRKNKDGLIINIASWAGRFHPYVVGPAYIAAKHSVVAISHSLNIEECTNGIRSCTICPGEVATEIILKRPVPPTKEELQRMLQAEDLGHTIRFVAEMPPHVCVNEILISPTWNRVLIGGPGLEPKRDKA